MVHYLRFVDLLPGVSSYNTRSFATVVGEVIACTISTHLSCRFVSKCKQCCRSVLYFLFGFGGVMFVKFIVPSWNVCLAVASWYVVYNYA